ncbi:MAG: winged helix-turn-helix domain-containing protein [Spirochaetota bacterium]
MKRRERERAKAPGEERPSVASVDRIIHEPARLMICALLSGVDRADFLFVQRETELTKGNLSSHLSKLEDAGYVEVTKTYEGKRPLTLVTLTDAGRVAFAEYRALMGSFMDGIGGAT